MPRGVASGEATGPGSLDREAPVYTLRVMALTSPVPARRPPSRQEPRSTTERRLVLWLFVVTAGALLLVQEGAITGYDGQTMYEVTKSMVERRDVAVAREWNSLPGRDGRYYGRYGIGLSIVGLLPYAAVHAVAGTGDRADALGEAVVSATMPLIAAALVAAGYLLARRLGARAGPALLVAIGSVVGTFLLPYTKEFFSEPLAAFGIVLAVERVLARRPAAGVGMAVAVLARPQSLVFVPLLLLVVLRRQGVRAVLGTAAPIGASVVLTLAYNLVRFGNPLHFGYQDQGFTTPFLEGAAGLLLDPAKSVLLFAPVVLLVPFALGRLWRADRDAFTLIAGNLAVTFVITATWFSWMGGWAWGPRLLIPGLVPAFAAVGPWLSSGFRRRLAVALLAVGFLVSVPAVVVSTQAQQLDTPPPEIGPEILRQAELLGPITRHTVQDLYEPDRDGRNYLRYLSVWQVGAARVFQRPGLLLAAVGTLGLLAVVLWSGRRTVRAFRETAADPDRLTGRPRYGGSRAASSRRSSTTEVGSRDSSDGYCCRRTTE
jgi:hypothetical protein